MKVTHREWFRLVDKVAWAKGKWDHEADRVQWEDEASGYPCLIQRAFVSGAWCGYVGVPSSNRVYGMSFNDVEDLPEGDQGIEVHGGLTFANLTFRTKKPHDGVYIEGDDQPEKLWWIGFDCAHDWDIMPALNATLRGLGHGAALRYEDVYRTQEYVMAEVKLLAGQLREFEEEDE